MLIKCLVFFGFVTFVSANSTSTVNTSETSDEKITSSTAPPKVGKIELTWIAFGDREAGDEMVVWDKRAFNSSRELTSCFTFKYDKFRFTFANLTTTENYDKIVHNYDDNSSSTDILFNDSNFVLVEMIIYGVYGENSSRTDIDSQDGTKMGKSKKEKKMVLFNPRKL